MCSVYLYAKATHRVYIELPEEDGGGIGSRRCGMLKKSLHGTRGAAHNWERELGGFLEEIGLCKGEREECLHLEAAPKSERLSTDVFELTLARVWKFLLNWFNLPSLS